MKSTIKVDLDYEGRSYIKINAVENTDDLRDKALHQFLERVVLVGDNQSNFLEITRICNYASTDGNSYGGSNWSITSGVNKVRVQALSIIEGAFYSCAETLNIKGLAMANTGTHIYFETVDYKKKTEELEIWQLLGLNPMELSIKIVQTIKTLKKI